MTSLHFWLGVIMVMVSAVGAVVGAQFIKNNWGYWNAPPTSELISSKDNKAASITYKIASVLPNSEYFDFLKDGKVWFRIENLEQRKFKAYIKITFISDGFRQELTEGYYGGEKPWKLNAFSGIQAPGLIMPEEIKKKAIQKKKIEIQIGCVIKDEDDKLIDTKLPIGYVYDYSIKEWYLEP